MKVGVVGVGAVGASSAKAMLIRGSCAEIVLVEKDEEDKRRLAIAVATDLSHGAALCPPAVIRAGGVSDLDGASVVIVTAGVNEQTGKAIDRNDPRGRLLLLPENVQVYAELIPQIAQVAPNAVLLIVTDPPDPLADVARGYVATNPVISAGTFLDTLRFRFQIARRVGCVPSSVDALVIGEHGTSQVFLWSSASIGGRPVVEWIGEEEQARVEADVKFANIDIIAGTGASQHGIGIVSARIVEAILYPHAGSVFPVGIHHAEFGVTLSLPSLVGAGGVSEVITPAMSSKERDQLVASAKAIRDALADLPPSLRKEELREIIPVPRTSSPPVRPSSELRD